MGKLSTIQWTDATWNIARGCSKVDEDCKFCYMYRQSLSGTRYNPLEIKRTKTVFNLPLTIKKPSKIFASSLTDFFHPAIDSYRNEVWEIIRKCPQHTFQILTKRPERITQYLPPDWGDGLDNVWLGTSVGGPNGLQRIEDLKSVKAKIKFLSLEPLHAELDLMYPKEFGEPQRCCSGRDCGCMGMPVDPPIIFGIDWVIVGGESGNEIGKYRYRPCEISWIEKIVDVCQKHDVPVFVKQLGTHLSKQLKLKDRHGGNINEFPENLRVREFPKQKVKI
jgi:protein gp37